MARHALSIYSRWQQPNNLLRRLLTTFSKVHDRPPQYFKCELPSRNILLAWHATLALQGGLIIKMS